MTGTIDEFKQLVDAEEFFKFFDMSYDVEVVNVNRLHILKKFSQYMKEIDDNSPDLSQEEKL
ncbi:MAG: nitrogenase-stabilizing/protective protein NifW, partial [Nostoc sp.]